MVSLIVVAVIGIAVGAYLGAKSAGTVSADIAKVKADIAAILAAIKAKI